MIYFLLNLLIIENSLGKPYLHRNNYFSNKQYFLVCSTYAIKEFKFKSIPDSIIQNLFTTE